MANCPRPGCAGEVVHGNCQSCGIAVETSAEQEAERLRWLAEEQASLLPEAAEGTAEGKAGPGWFRREAGSGSVAAGAADSPVDSPVRGSADSSVAADEPQPVRVRGRASRALPWEIDRPDESPGEPAPPYAEALWGREHFGQQHGPDEGAEGVEVVAEDVQAGRPAEASPPPVPADDPSPPEPQEQAPQLVENEQPSPEPPRHAQPEPAQPDQAPPARPAPAAAPAPPPAARPGQVPVAGPGPQEHGRHRQQVPPGPAQPGPMPPGYGHAGYGQPGQPGHGRPGPGQPYGQPGPGAWSQGGGSQGGGSQGGPPRHGYPPPPNWNVHTGQRGAPLWGQNIPMPNVVPLPPGSRPPPALSEDDPQPTSALDDPPQTLTIAPPAGDEPTRAHVPDEQTRAEPRDEVTRAQPRSDEETGDEATRAEPAAGEPTRSEPAGDDENEDGPPTTADSLHSTGSSSFPTGRRTSSRASGRGRLGAGLVDVPVVPVKDPASAVLTDPAVSENKRFCSHCGAAVGRGKDGEPGATEGECVACETPFNFRPRLSRGDLVGGQYEVLGCLAYGGLGWIYLAKDHNVSDRWVVLKGMIDTGDTTSMASAVAERQFLAEVEHPNVVRIYNFVQHPDPGTGTLAGYIVMEFVGGQSLRQLALSHHRETGRAEPLPIGQVIAYGLEILPAIGYLHSTEMLYCDLKPDNVIQSGEQLKLIDLGAVRRTEDYESPLFFTLGYSAPELASDGATIASDIYTVGRTLAVLSIEFSGYTTRHKYTLPAPEEEPLFALFGSYYRVLKRATHTDPVRRFTSAEEMADQLTGVLREVMALGTGRPRPGQSTVFAMETRTFGAGLVVGEGGSLPAPDPQEVASILPLPMVDTDDHAASALASITTTEPAELVAALASAPQDSIEVRLRMVRARLEQGDLRAAAADLDAARRLVTDPADWRPDWYEGLIAIAAFKPAEASAAFEKVYDAVPGEIPPKLALAVSAEYARNYFAAARFYELVWRTDHAWVSAAFGLARTYLAQGGRVSAIEVLEAVPDTSSHHVAAQVAAIKIKTGGAHLGEHDLHDAARRLERLALDAERRMTLSAEVLEAAYAWVSAGRPGAAAAGSDGRMVLGYRLAERELRFGLERCYRALARLAGTPEQRHELVDKANAIRPRTLT